MKTKVVKRKRKGTKKNNVILREKKLVSGSSSLYLEINRDGTRLYEFLKLYIDNKARTPIETQTKKETWELAERIRTERESELNHSVHGQISPSSKKVLFVDYAESYLKNYTKKDVRMIKGAIERFKKFLGDKMPEYKIHALRLSQIDKPMMVGFVEYLNEKSKGEGGQSYYSRFKKLLKHAVDNELLSKSPTNGVICQAPEGLRKDILSNDEIALLAKTPTQNEQIRSAFILSCCTGLRFCDVKALKYSDIDFAAEKLRKKHQEKTGKPVIVDLNNTAKKTIGEPGEPNDLVFDLPTHAGCDKTVLAWVKRAGIKKHITWHCARHSFAVNMLTSPERPDIKTVASTLGHTGLKHVEKYTRVVDELKKKAVNALPDYDF